MSNGPKLIDGGMAIDDRGSLSFVNDFNFDGVKRFYSVENFSLDTIRAFHGHKKEAKYVFVPEGSALVCIVKIDDFDKPDQNTEVERFVLSSKKPSILYVPAGYANGFKSLEENTKIFFYSTSTLDESKDDDYRFSFDHWGKKIWQTENR